jgi:hypothetical protein
MLLVTCYRDLSVDNLRFLSSEQALADLASFRTFLATSRNLTNNKWIAFGGSYPGIYFYIVQLQLAFNFCKKDYLLDLFNCLLFLMNVR